MADTRKPLPVATRLEIKERRSQGETVRHIAGSLHVSKTTVVKYQKNRGTRLLNNDRESA